MQLEFDVQFSPELERTFRGAYYVGEELTLAMEYGTELLVQTIAPLVNVGVAGTLRQGVQSQVYGTAAGVEGRVFNPVGYAVPVEVSGKAHAAPLKKIEQWVRRKLGGTREDARAIWMHIRRSGTKAHPSFAPGLERARDRVQARFDAIPARVIARIEGGLA